MRDVLKLPDGEDMACEEANDMNFTFTTSGGAGGSPFITTAQMPKLQQNVANNGATLQQVVGMVGSDGGVQYMRTLDGGATLHAPQLITLPIALPGAKPGDPQQTVQIQVLGPNMTLQQQQPKYQMQIPIQGFQQGGAVLTLAYAPEGNDAMQLVNTLPEGVQVVALPAEQAALLQQAQDTKDHVHQMLQQQQAAFNSQIQHIIINNNQEVKILNNNNNNNNDGDNDVIIKEECEDTNDDESSQGTTEGGGGGAAWAAAPGNDLVQYFNKLPPQQTQSLPVSLQQFLILNGEGHKKGGAGGGGGGGGDDSVVEIEVPIVSSVKDEDDEDSPKAKRKKRYKKKAPKPAKPKPGQVVITTSGDGTPLYCCPECQMAYSEKSQLELHLSVHKIERRFICGICGAGLKRKEHLDRHKQGHNPERPYVCAVCRKGFKRREHLNLHTVIHSGVKTEMCQECGKGFYRKDHLRKHTRSHESKRAREEMIREHNNELPTRVIEVKPPSQPGESAEITIHVPTSANVQVPVQINIPQHVVSSLTAQQAAQLTGSGGTGNGGATTLDALLAQHS